MKIISHRKYEEEIIYERNFSNADGRGGYGFPCTKEGKVDLDSLADAAKENWALCLKGGPTGTEIIDNGINQWTHRWLEPAIGICERCSTKVVLDGFTNTCDRCHADYNMSGQRLAPRSQWGWDTGETLADILRIK